MERDDNSVRKGRESLLTVLLALLFGGGFLFFLILVSGGFFLYVVSAVFAIVLVGAFHYLVWGFAMTQEVAGEREELEARDRSEARRELPPRPDDYHVRRK